MKRHATLYAWSEAIESPSMQRPVPGQEVLIYEYESTQGPIPIAEDLAVWT